MGEPLSENWKPQLNLAIKPVPDLALAPKDATPQGIELVRRDWELKQAAWPKEQLIKWESPDDIMVSIFWTSAGVFLILGVVSAVMALGEMSAFFSLACVFGFMGLFGFASGGRPFRFRVRSGKERMRLRAVRSWLKLHRREIKALRAKVVAFNQAIKAFQEIEERHPGTLDGDIMVATHKALENQCATLQAEVDNLISELDGVEKSSEILLSGSKDEAKASRRRAEREAQRVRKDERRKLEAARTAFRERVKVWQKFDRGLAQGPDNGRYDATQDITPYVAAMQMRAKLEAECSELGLSPSELPEPTSVLRLPAKSGG